MSLTGKQKNLLRKSAHKLKPVIIVGGSGLTESVYKEITQSLAHHELIKIKIGAAEKKDRLQIINEIQLKTSGEIVQTIGHIMVLFKASDANKYSI